MAEKLTAKDWLGGAGSMAVYAAALLSGNPWLLLLFPTPILLVNSLLPEGMNEADKKQLLDLIAGLDARAKSAEAALAANQQTIDSLRVELRVAVEQNRALQWRLDSLLNAMEAMRRGDDPFAFGKPTPEPKQSVDPIALQQRLQSFAYAMALATVAQGTVGSSIKLPSPNELSMMELPGAEALDRMLAAVLSPRGSDLQAYRLDARVFERHGPKLMSAFLETIEVPPQALQDAYTAWSETAPDSKDPMLATIVQSAFVNLGMSKD